LIGSTSAVLQQTKLSSSSLHRNPIDERYSAGCASILKGFDQIDYQKYRGNDIFGTWEYQDSNGQLLKYFENRKGIVKIKNTGTTTYWSLDLIFYDGNYIDQNNAAINLNLDWQYSLDLMINQPNG